MINSRTAFGILTKALVIPGVLCLALWIRGSGGNRETANDAESEMVQQVDWNDGEVVVFRSGREYRVEWTDSQGKTKTIVDDNFGRPEVSIDDGNRIKIHYR